MQAIIEEYGQSIALMIFGGSVIVLFGKLLAWIVADSIFFA